MSDLRDQTGLSAGSVRLAIVGVGRFGRIHAMKLAQMPEVDLIGIADIDRDRGGELAHGLSVPFTHDYRDLIGHSQAAVITATTSAHHDIAAAFLETGSDVFIEKPMATTAVEAEDLVQKARKTGAILQVGHIERFGTLFKRIRQYADRPLYIETVRIAPFGLRGTDVSVVLDVMIHDLDLVIGLVAAPLEEVSAIGAPIFSENDDIASARLTFANGCVANLTASRISMKRERRMRIFQQDHFLSADFDANSIRVIRKSAGAGSPGIDTEDFQAPRSDPLQLELDNFIHCVRTRERPLVSGEEGRDALIAAIMVTDTLKAHHDRLRRSGLVV
ncbi:Gfo/Idh/MocA family oxidoreductase [Rhizobiales bacterium]|uniref:Gfo/Idh/MocA family protein n=1 Tax=Hongsoonwoonella zoysiae TaxID=2821844 RepID=UPI0015604093|nr:Gfo/Idh/MocA family oxidoreductase [Hongsoonwoonella zoysiae]NRG18129.1 Gfo/Idh/MocA family oxidoreductase [Hongsoonwoonella zoysiae]